MKKKNLLKLIIILLSPMMYILVKIAERHPFSVDKYYSHGFFPFISHTLNLISGIFPFSVMEVLVVLCVVFLIGLIIHIFRRPTKISHKITSFLIDIIAFSSILYVCFQGFWGLNYYRPSFAQLSNLDVRPSSTQELKDLCVYMINQTNTLRESIPEDDNGVAKLPLTNKQIFDNAHLGYEKVAEIYPFLSGKYPAAKGILLSYPMTYTGIWGVYCPYTGEANVNTNIPSYFIPSTVCHEMAHQRGFAREDEANYIGFLTASLNPYPEFRYSAYIDAVIDCMNALYSASPETFSEVHSLYSEPVIRDLKYLTTFNDKYSGVVEKVSNSLNDMYLKSNNQSDGVKSYGRMVDLLLAQYRKDHSK